MSPLNDFYSVENWNLTESGLSCTVSFNAAHKIFNGHFPGNPIVPGVCTIQIIADLLQRATGQQLQLSQAPNIKFLQLITPHVRPEVNISWTESEEIYTTNTSLKIGDATLFKMNASFSKKS